MENAVLVRDEADRKILILYVLRALPCPVDSELLFDICFCDDGLGYFDYSVCLSELVRSGNVQEIDDEYAITEKGARNVETLMTHLPFSVRSAADRRIGPAVRSLARYQLITSEISREEQGAFVHLALSDGEVQLAELRLFCGNEDLAKRIRKNFRHNAELCYQELLSMLAESGKERK